MKPDGIDPIAAVRSHFDRLLATGLAVYGPRPSAMWMASLDTRTGRYPADDARPAHLPKRVYRNIDAPKGCSLYWDQPSVVAAHALSAATGDDRYSAAADAYVRDFLARCVAANGILLWGNHYYYDAFRDAVMFFGGSEDPLPVDPAAERGLFHEIRPIPPAWDSFARVSPGAAERAVRAAADGHVLDPETGRFQRHAWKEKRGCAFLEAGGILVEAMAWLAARNGDRSLVEAASRVAGYSFAHRGAATGLLENNPAEDRWDKRVTTSEVGLWAGCLLRAAALAGRAEWREMAAAAVSAWLAHAWDPAAGRFFGKVSVADGTPALGPKTTPYQPGDYCDLWEPLFPAHDYPMPMAESCLALWTATGREEFLAGAERWAAVIGAGLPARGGRGGYAEYYGRCMHFLLGLADATGRAEHRALAGRVAGEALAALFAHGMFRGHPGEDRYDAVDGVGFLLLALVRLATGREPDMMGMGW